MKEEGTLRSEGRAPHSGRNPFEKKVMEFEGGITN